MAHVGIKSCALHLSVNICQGYAPPPHAAALQSPCLRSSSEPRTRVGQLWTHAITVDGWKMLSVDLIIECLVGVGSAKQKKRWLPPSCGNHFTAVMALLINHHKLHPATEQSANAYEYMECFSCVLWRSPLDLVWTPRSKPWSNPFMISSHLSYTNMLIICVWENTDWRACKLIRVKKTRLDIFPRICLGRLHCSLFHSSSFINCDIIFTVHLSQSNDYY